jgi:hypothetical protein
MSEHTNIRWYGERGIVNALVTDLAIHGSLGAIELLKCVEWADDQKKGWLDEIERAEMIVEVKLAHFGDPDLIIVCHMQDKRTRVFFIEAKVITYQASVENGGSSSINRQLTLKYRFAQALMEWAGSREPIREPQWCHNAYHQASVVPSLSESRTAPRYVAKSQVLDICRDVKMQKLNEQDVFFVAWTWDRTAFFRIDDFERSESRPLFLGKNGDEVLADNRSRVGWLGYNSINDNPRLRTWLTPAYESAFCSMRNDKAPKETVPINTGSLLRIEPYNVEKNSCRQVRELMTSLASAARDQFGHAAVDERAGSTSITLHNPLLSRDKVLVKLVPQDHESDEYIKLGISTSLNQRTWAGRTFDELELIGAGNNWQPFFTVPLANDAVDFACAVFAELTELIGLSNLDDGPHD